MWLVCALLCMELVYQCVFMLLCGCVGEWVCVYVGVGVCPDVGSHTPTQLFCDEICSAVGHEMK